MKRAEVYEPFYQFLKEPSDSEKWKALRGLVDNLVAETEHDTIDRVLKIIDSKRGAFRDGSFRDSSITYMQGWMRSNDAIKKAVSKLKEGEQE